MSAQIGQDVREMSTLTSNGNRLGLTNIGSTGDELNWPPNRFITEVGNAKFAIDLCGATLYYVYSNDAILDALVAAAARNVPVRILLPAPESPLLVATFQSDFRSAIGRLSKELSDRIKSRQSNIQLKHLKEKTLTMSILRIDDNMLAVPYLYKFQTGESPHFFVRGSGTPMFKTYESEFTALFAVAEQA